MQRLIMKIKLSLTLLLLVIANFISAQTSDKTEGCAPLQITFTAPAGHPTWYWEFGDNASSIQQNPINTYITPGTYTVTFSETPGGAVIGTPIIVKVYTKPTYQVTANSPTKGCVPLNVSMSASGVAPLGVTINSYSWVYGDGGSGAGNSVNHTYVSPGGVFDVSVKINTSSPTCDTTKVFSKFISASDPPVAAFVTNPDPAISCTAPLTVSFTNTSTSALPITYSWNLHNGPLDTSQTPAPITYSSDGNYSVDLTVTDTNTCSRTTTKGITVGKPLSSFTMPDTVCLNIPFPLDNNTALGGSGNYLWTFDAGTSLASSSVFEPFIAFSTPGTHTVTLRATAPNGLCFDDSVATIFVENPSVTFTSNPTYSCSEPRAFQFTGTSTATIASWQWLFGDGSTSTLQNPNHTFVIGDSIYSKRGRKIFNNTLSVITTSGCLATYTAPDTIHLVWARFQPDTAQGCAPLTVTFYDSSKSNTPTEPLVSWAWNYDDGSPVNNRVSKNPHTHTFTSPGKYDVFLIATNNKGCKDTSYAITISVGDQKAIDFTADKLSICPGEAVSFTHTTTDTAGITGWNYQSNGEMLSHCFQDDTPSLVFNDSTGLQDITLTVDYNGCLTTVTKADYITVKGPIAHFDYLTTCGTSSDVVEFTDLSGDATGVSWDFGDASAPLTTTGTFSYTYAATGDYQVILTATNGGSGCADSKDTATIHVKKIQADFASDTTYCIGVNYAFDASPSIDVYGSCYRGYTWIFSEPTARPITSSLPISSIKFDSAGVQTIGLIVQDINGCIDTLIQSIKVYNTPALYTISDAIICTPDTIQFTDISVQDTTIVKWAWTFGDGVIDSVQHPIHIYNTVPGATVVTTLTITDTLGCISSSTQNISIYDLTSTVSTAPASPNICLGTPITFSASDFTAQGSNLSYNWDYKDGTIEPGNNLSHTFASAGTYIVEVYYTEVASGCNDSTTKTVTVQDYPHAGYSTDVDGLTVLCNPQIINFTDTSTVEAYSMPLTQTWDFGNGGSLVPGATPTFVFSKGTHSVKMTSITSNGCTDDTTKTFVVVGPAGDFDMDTTNICKGDVITFTIKDTVDVGSYTWDYGDGLTTNNVSPSAHTYYFIPPSGQTVAKLIVFGQGGVCPVSVQKDVFIHYVKADFARNSGLDTAICLGQQMALNNNSSILANSYEWTFGDSDSLSTVDSTVFNHLYDSTGTYDVTLAVRSSLYGCVDTITKQVIVNPLPTITAIGDSVCLNDTAYLSVLSPNPAYSYSWTPTGTLNNPNISNPNFPGTTSGLYAYYVTATVNSTGCSSVDTAPVFIAEPLVDYLWDTSIVIGEYINLPIDNQNGFVNFTWTPTTGLSCLTCSNPQLQPLEDITYSAFMADILGCTSATATFEIHIYPEIFAKLPTTFTPNGDGVNDIIYVNGWGIKDLVSFEIYNRWGELVFKTSEITEGWDGYYKGMLQNNDIYVYKVNALSFRETEMLAEGHINLMR